MERVKKAYAAGLRQSFVVDMVFLGSASGMLYPWDPAPIAELDVCIFFKNLDRECGVWLQTVERNLAESLAQNNFDFEFRMVNGPYKRAPSEMSTMIIIAHGIVYTEERYLDEAKLLRWSWRKYPCIKDPNRMSRLAPELPSIGELLKGPRGVEERIHCLENARAIFWERVLPSFEWIKFAIPLGTELFTEYCLAAGADTARNHARILAFKEADTLGNNDFFPWYVKEVFPSEALEELIEMKRRARVSGYAGMSKQAHTCAHSYLRALHSSLTQASSK